MDARCAPSMKEYETWSLSFSPSSLFDPIKPTEYCPWSHWISSVFEQLRFSSVLPHGSAFGSALQVASAFHSPFSAATVAVAKLCDTLRYSLYLFVINLNCSWVMWFTWGLKDAFWTASPNLPCIYAFDDAVWAEKYPPQKPCFLERQDNVGYGHSPVMALMCRVF